LAQPTALSAPEIRHAARRKHRSWWWLPTGDPAAAGARPVSARLLQHSRFSAAALRGDPRYLAGDRDTGISIMRMDAGLDAGPVC
jgi:hypothetical protein